MRRPFVAGNWKMYTSARSAGDLVAGVVSALAGVAGVDVVLCPPYTSLPSVSDGISGTAVGLGAQDLHWESEGPFTGEVSGPMLREAGCGWVIVGHSERRTHFGETDERVNLKARAALAAGLSPIVCVGETLEQREAGRTEDVVREQVDSGLRDLAAQTSALVVAYEPVWAIGTGRTAGPEQAEQVHRFIRARVAAVAGEAAADDLRIVYGGSVKPANAAALFAEPDIDGGLIGGASLEAGSFAAIVRSAAAG